MEPKELWNLTVLILVWYVANLGFNVGMKRSHALVPDVLGLTAFQFGAGAIAFCGAWLTGHAELPHARCISARRRSPPAPRSRPTHRQAA